jgi:hypothetical protein
VTEGIHCVHFSSATGATLDAQSALGAGLITKILGAEKPKQRAVAVAEAIAANPPLAVRTASQIPRRLNGKYLRFFLGPKIRRMRCRRFWRSERSVLKIIEPTDEH